MKYRDMITMDPDKRGGQPCIRGLRIIASHYPGSSQVTLLGLERASDTAIWSYARQHDFVVVTKDSDFLGNYGDTFGNYGDTLPFTLFCFQSATP